MRRLERINALLVLIVTVAVGLPALLGVAAELQSGEITATRIHGPGGRGAAVLYLRGAGSVTMYDEDGQVSARFPEEER